MARQHAYAARLVWTGAAQGPTKDYKSYSRDYEVEIEGKPTLAGSADAAFRGDPARHDPEHLLVAALSACHMLWYLHLCAEAGILVTAYEDEASGSLVAEPGNGRFTEVVLHPAVTIAAGDKELAESLHERAHKECFIANSVNFPVRHEARISEA